MKQTDWEMTTRCRKTTSHPRTDRVTDDDTSASNELSDQNLNENIW